MTKYIVHGKTYDVDLKEKPYVKKTKYGWQVYVPGPHGYIPQGQPHSTKEKAEKDARAFKVTMKSRKKAKKTGTIKTTRRKRKT